VPPVSAALEERIISGLLTDLNNTFDLGLDTKPNLTRASAKSKTTKPKILVIGAAMPGALETNLKRGGKRCSGSAALAGDPPKLLYKKFFQRLKM
jgi:hypothetical protein